MSELISILVISSLALFVLYCLVAPIIGFTLPKCEIRNHRGCDGCMACAEDELDE